MLLLVAASLLCWSVIIEKALTLYQVFTRQHRDAGLVIPKENENWRTPCAMDEDCQEET